jgi:hypothetical protein
MVEVTTIILTAVCTGIGISMGNALYDVFLKDYFKKLKAVNKKTQKKIHAIVHYKRPWLAALLNFFIWGLGYLYVNKKKGLGIMLIAIQIFVSGGLLLQVAEIHGSFEFLNYSFLSLLLSGYLAFDAHKLAKDSNLEG